MFKVAEVLKHYKLIKHKDDIQSFDCCHLIRLVIAVDKPFVERIVGSLNLECFRLGIIGSTAVEQPAVIDHCLAKPHFYHSQPT